MLRVVTRVATAILGLVLLLLGILAIVDVILAAFDRRGVFFGRAGVYDTLVDARLNDNIVMIIAGAVGLLGVLILVTQLVPRHATRVPAEIEPGWFLRRRSVERQINQAAGAEPTVTKAKTTIRKRGRRWRTTVTVAADPAAEPAVLDAAYQVLTRMTAADGTVRVVTKGPGRRVA